MPVTPIYLAQVRRTIARLRDPYPLDVREQAKVDGLLSADELVDVERRRQEIKAGNNFMTAPVDHEGWPYYHLGEEGSPLQEKIVLALRDSRYSLKKWKAEESRLVRAKALNYKNPASLNVLRSEVDRWKTLHMSYIDSVRLAWEATDPEVKRRLWYHRGEWKLDNLPRRHPDWELMFWPDHPTSARQAYIEVLTEKLHRLSS